MNKKVFFILISIAVVAGIGYFTATYLIKKQDKLHLGGKAAPTKRIIKKSGISYSYTKSAPKTVIPIATVKPKTANIAIVLDDWGNNYGLLKDAIGVGRPLTLAVLPKLAYTKRIATEARASGLGVILHMPMQPFPTKEQLEPHTLTVDMPSKQIIQYLDEALESVSTAEGVNNHMGSRVTSDLRVMRIVLEHLKKRGYFFLDSNVISTTVGPDVAEEYGINFAKRDVFIDNDLDKESILEQLNVAKKIALTKGQAVVIGHDRKVTLQAIKEVVTQFEKEGIRFVLVKELVKPAGNSS